MVDEHKQMAVEMGRQKIVPMDFAEENLYKMAGQEIKGHITDFRKSVHIPDFNAYSIMSCRRIIRFMNNSGQKGNGSAYLKEKLF